MDYGKFVQPVEVELLIAVNCFRQHIVLFASHPEAFYLDDKANGGLNCDCNPPGLYHYSCKIKAVDVFVPGVGFVKRFSSTNCYSRPATNYDLINFGVVLK